ncbi:MAG: hypothetical protein GX654_17330 [Desulfatiglans sp.]|nr:hypothetical protein [Desulfatiglans sp.]
MDKDDNLFEDEIKENIDLLDIGLDDLTDNTGEATGEGDDEGVIELTDLLEKGGAELFEEDEILKDDIRFTDDLVGFSDDLIETETDKKGGFDDLLLEADISAPADDLGLNLTEEGPDELLPDENLPDDSGTTPSDSDITGDLFEKLLEDTVLDELTEDTEELPEVRKEFILEPEDFSDLESALEEEPISDEKIVDNPAPVSVQGNLFRDFDTGAPATEKTEGTDYEQTAGPDIFGGDLEKTIASSDDDSDSKPLWGTDDDINTEAVSILEEISADDEKIEFSGVDEGDPGYVHLDDIQLDGKVLETIFPDEVATEGVIVSSASADLTLAESQDLLLRDVDQPDTAPPLDSVQSEIPVIDDSGPEDEIPAVPLKTTMQPAISEERIEEIVTKVVTEVVEKVAREVFKDVAEKVISEAIEGLKKSLEAESE